MNMIDSLNEDELKLIARCYERIAIRMIVESGESENITMKNYFNGIDIVISKNLVTGYEQKRKHRKRRINKKWLKQYGSKPIYDMNYYYIGNKIYMSPKAFEALNIEKEIIE